MTGGAKVAEPVVAEVFVSFVSVYGRAMAVELRSDDPATFLSQARETLARGGALRLVVDGTEMTVEGDLAEGIVTLVEDAGSGRILDVTLLPEEITTGQAADLLGVSRPTVVKLADDGHLPCMRIGTHRRLKTKDVLSFRDQAKQGRREAFAELVALSDELGLYDE